MVSDMHSPPEVARRKGGYAFFDIPASGVCSQPLIVCSGWMIRDGTDVTFEVNGVPVEHIRFTKRAGVEALYPDSDVAGFEFWIDANRYMRPPSRALHLVARGRDILAERFFRVRPRDADEASTSLLTFFLHMSKTGGTAIRRHMEIIAASAAPPYEGILPAYHVPQLMALRPETLSFFDFVFGHFWYGVHDVARERPYTYVTVLRDPYEYLISLYFYQKNVTGAISHSSIHAFLADAEARPEIDNHFTRTLCGLDRQSRVTADHVQMAKDNIDRNFAFVGLAEDMPRTLHALSVLTGFDLRDTGRENVTPAAEERTRLDRAAFAAAARDLVRHDIEIYRYVRTKFSLAVPDPQGSELAKASV